MPPLLVTGGCGFIGSNFVRHLLQSDPAVSIINFDALTYAGNLANLADLEGHPRYKFVRGDVADRAAVRKVVERGVCGIIHFAAESHVDRSIQDSGPFVRTNVVGTQILLDAAREFEVPRYVQVSTDEVYGSLGPTGAFTEETPLASNSPYSASKAAADLLVRSYVHRYAIDCSKIERELGWKPTISFADGLKETIRWYLDNQPWVNTIRSGDYLKYYEKQYGSRLAS